MNKPSIQLFALIVAAALAWPGVSPAQAFKVQKYSIGGDGGTDYLLAEPGTGRVFVSRGTHVMVVDGPGLPLRIEYSVGGLCKKILSPPHIRLDDRNNPKPGTLSGRKRTSLPAKIHFTLTLRHSVPAHLNGVFGRSCAKT